MRVRLKLMMIFLTAVAAGLHTLSCARRDQEDAGQVLRILASEFGPWSWFFDPEKFLVFMSLTEQDTRTGGSLPRLAQRWEHTTDHRTWTFHLHSDVRWHDGEPLTAHDVEFSVLLHDRYHGTSSFSETRVVDDTTIIIRRAEPWSEPDWWLTIYPRHLLAHLDPATLTEWEFWQRPVGSGPYRYRSHVDATMVELEANPDFVFGGPRIPFVRVQYGGGSPVPELRAGNVDMAVAVNVRDLQVLLRDARFEHHYHSWFGGGWLFALYWNQRSPLFRDAVVRRALTMALDRRGLRSLYHIPEDMPLFDVIFTGRQYWNGDIPPAIEYDTAGARRLLATAGWRDTDGDGLLDRAGKPFRFTAHVSTLAVDLTQAAVYTQAALARVGVRMDLVTDPAPAVRFGEGDFDAMFFRYHNARPGHERAFGAKSVIGYRDSVVSAALEQLPRTVDPTAVDSIYQALMSALKRDLPVMFLFPQVQHIVAHRRVRGIESPFRSQPGMFAEYYWLAPDAAAGTTR